MNMITPDYSYPDDAIVALDKRCTFKLGTAAIQRIATGYRWCEGPVYFHDHRSLVWSDIPNNRMMRWSEADEQVTVFRQPSNYSNGNTRDRQGRLVTCEHGGRRVTRTEYNGQITVLADNFGGKKLNAPNDVIVDSQGAIWFTDPGYGIDSDYEGYAGEYELPRCVYRIDPHTGAATIATDELRRPNGLAMSADEKFLYVVDSNMEDGAKPSIRRYVVSGNKISNGKTFTQDFAGGTSDGIKFDRQGNLWSSIGWGDRNENGVRCFAPDGTLLGKILLPEPASNLCFGGEKNNRLFITAGTSVYSVYLKTNGHLTV